MSEIGDFHSADVPGSRVPPCSIAAEQSVLGSPIIDDKAWPMISGMLRSEDFFRADHRTIYAAIAALQNGCSAVDFVTVTEYLERNGIIEAAGGPAYIGRLVRDTPTAANVVDYANVVRERSSLRSLQSIAEGIISAATDFHGSTAVEIIAHAQDQLQCLHSRARSGRGLIDVGQLVGELTDDLDARSAGPTGLRVGLADFDELTCGLEPGDLGVIGARPGIGKSALMGSIGDSASRNTGVAIFSAEMHSRQLMRRFVSMHSNVPQRFLRHAEDLKDDQWQKIAEAASEIAIQNMWIDDTPAPTFTHIRTECMALKARAPLGLVLIDYVQLVRGMGANRYEQLREVAYGLKAMAKELMVPVIAFAQLNRGVEAREMRRPQISDLRDCGAIEEAADIVTLLYSEAYYDVDFPMPYVLEGFVAKNRNGERGSCLWLSVLPHVILLPVAS